MSGNSNEKTAFEVGDVLTNKVGSLMLVTNICIGKDVASNKWEVVIKLHIRRPNGTECRTQVKMEEIIRDMVRKELWIM